MDNKKLVPFLISSAVVVFLIGMVIFFILKYEKEPRVSVPAQKPPQVSAGPAQPLPAEETQTQKFDDQLPSENGKLLQ